jgi:phospholipid-binding lipoprotein MlaA
MFEFNRQLDRFILRNIAKAYDAALPDLIQKGIKNAINNVGVIRRLVNNLLQLKMEGAGTEVVRFTLNSTIGVAGLIDIAKEIGIRESDEDTGQTLAAYGIDHGPYLVLPFLPVTTVRDGVGSLVDVALNPLHYIFPAAGINGASTGISALGTVNERSMNLDKFGGVEETVIDLYGAVRNAYFQRRAAAVAE